MGLGGRDMKCLYYCPGEIVYKYSHGKKKILSIIHIFLHNHKVHSVITYKERYSPYKKYLEVARK